MTISEMRDEIIVDLGLDDEDSDVLAKVLAWIKQALRKLPLYARDRLLITTKSATLAASSNSLELPSDFINERYVYRVSGSARIEIRKQSYESFHASHSTSGSGNPNTYMIKDGVIYFDRSESEAETVYLEYFQDESGVSLTTDFFGSTDIAEIIKDLAKSYHFEYEEDYEGADRYIVKATDGFRRLDERYQAEELSGYIEEM